MELKLRPDAKNVEVIPQGPGIAHLTVKARIVNPDSEGVLFCFKNQSGELIVQKQLLPVNPNEIELKFVLEADVVNKLVESRRSSFLVNFPGNEGDLDLYVHGRLSMGQEIQKPSSDEIQPEDEPRKEEVKPEPPKTEPAPPPKAEVAKKTVPVALISAIAGGVLLLALIAVAIWYFLLRGDEHVQNIPSEPAVAQEPAVSADDPVKQDKAEAAAQGTAQAQSYGSCDVNSTSDDKALISNCMASKPDNEVLLKLGNDALKSGRCDIASRVFSSLGRSGAKGAALTYARYFDPASDLSSGCVKKDAAQAKYWYEKARDNGSESDVKAATAALESMK